MSAGSQFMNKTKRATGIWQIPKRTDFKNSHGKEWGREDNNNHLSVLEWSLIRYQPRKPNLLALFIILYRRFLRLASTNGPGSAARLSLIDMRILYDREFSVSFSVITLNMYTEKNSEVAHAGSNGSSLIMSSCGVSGITSSSSHRSGISWPVGCGSTTLSNKDDRNGWIMKYII
jgi:hypothetical protein